MSNVERTIQDSVCEKDELHLDKVEAHEIQASKRIEGDYEANFVLKLIRVAENRNESRHAEASPHPLGANTGLKALFATLDSRQEVELRYRWRSDLSGEQHFDMYVVGRSTAVHPQGAIDSAIELRQGVLASLEASNVGNFEFANINSALETKAKASPQQWEITPSGIVVPCVKGQDIGFVSPAPIRSHVILAPPMNPNGVTFEAFLQAGTLDANDLCLSIRVFPMLLSEHEVELVRAAYKNLKTGTAGQIYFERDDKGRIFDESLTAALLEQLERWISEPRGYCLRCTVYAEQRVPETLLEVLGADLFWGLPIEYKKSVALRYCVADSEDDLVRLNNCLHRRQGPANLVPSGESLIARGVPRSYRTVPIGLAKEGLFLGHCGPVGAERPVHLAESDRNRHCYIIGATGTGKSTLLNHMVTQDIQRGAGLCLIDPHGDLYAQVLDVIPKHRARDVVLMDLADFDYSVGLNFLECSGQYKDIQMNFIVNEMLMIFDRLYNMSIAGGPMFETYMRNALLTVMDNDRRTATLLDVVRFFEDERFRAYSKRHSTNSIAVSFWNRQARQAGGEVSFQNMAPYITSKLNQFTHNALLRPIIGQPKSTIDFRKAMDEGRIVLVNLAKGLLGEFDMRLLGMLVIGKLFKAALGRATLPLNSRKRFYVYIDEFQTLATPTVIGLLSEARKFGLSLTMANQHLAQLTEGEYSRGIADAVLGNVATLLFFRVGPKDADQLEAFTLPQLSAQDLQQLPDHHAACRMVSRNMPIMPFVLRSPPLSQSHNQEQRRIVQGIRRRARRTYVRRREQVEEQIMASWLRGDETVKTQEPE